MPLSEQGSCQSLTARHRRVLIGETTNQDDETMVTEETVLKVLDKPRKAYAILQATHPGGSTDALQVLLMEMREEGKVRFDIKKGTWRKV